MTRLRRVPQTRQRFRVLGYLLGFQNPHVSIRFFFPHPLIHLLRPAVRVLVCDDCGSNRCFHPLLFLFSGTNFFAFYLGTTPSHTPTLTPRYGWHISTKPRGYRQMCYGPTPSEQHIDAVGLSQRFRGFPGLLRRNTPVHVPRGKDQDLAPPFTPHLTKVSPTGLFSGIP